MPTDDFSNMHRRYDNALDRLDESDGVHPADYDAIRSWLQARDGDLAVSSLAQYCSRLRTLSEYSDIPLVDLDVDAVRTLFFQLRRNESVGRSGTPSPQTVYNFQCALHKFATDRGADWVSDFEASRPDSQAKTVDETDMLSQEDIAALVDTTTRPRNTALVEFLADTGARLTLMGSLRVCDVDLDGERATYRPNPNAVGLKGADIKPYPIIDAKASLRSYLRHSHPRPDKDEVALFHKFRMYDGEDGSLSPGRVHSLLSDLGDEAGIDKPTNPHNFRHSAITRMWREGYDKQEIQHRVQWSIDTNMWDRYVHVTAKEMNEQIFAEAGVVEESDALSQRRDRCGNCREVVAPHTHYCPNCGEPLSPDARDEFADANADIAQGMADVRDDRRRQKRAKTAEELNRSHRDDTSS